jgi:hypothetical protein
VRLTINSRILGKKLTFSRPGSAYVFVDLNDRPGTLGVQICMGGNTAGSTIAYYGDAQNQFTALCRTWYRAYMRSMRAQRAQL